MPIILMALSTSNPRVIIHARNMVGELQSSGEEGESMFGSQGPAQLVACHHLPSLAFFAVDDHVAVVNGLVDERC